MVGHGSVILPREQLPARQRPTRFNRGKTPTAASTTALSPIGLNLETIVRADLACQKTVNPGQREARNDIRGIRLDEMASLRRQLRGPATVSRVWIAIELAMGLVFLGSAALAGLLLAKRPGPNRVDAAGYFYVPSDPRSHLANELVRLGSLPVLLTGVAVIFAVAIFRDWVRAFACAAAPIVAVEVVEHIAKPMVGRQIGAGSFTYPSGTVAAVAALAAAVFLVSPRLVRPLSAVAGAMAVAAVGAAVLVLRWHYPTDVIGGVWVGGGAVFFIDAAAHVPWLFAPPRPWFDTPLRVSAKSPPVQV